MSDDLAYVPRAKASRSGPSWFSTFSATLCGVVLGGAILLVGVRFYVRWTVQQWGEEIGQRMNKFQEEIRARAK